MAFLWFVRRNAPADDLDDARSELREIAEGLRAQGADAVGLPVDVGNPASLDALADQARDQFGGCDLLAANVGVQRIARFDAMTREEFAWLVQTNVIGTADTVRARRGAGGARSHVRLWAPLSGRNRRP